MNEKVKRLVVKGEKIPPQNVPVMQFLGRPDIPTIFIDKFLFSKRPDGTVITSGIQGVPGAEIEQLRFMVTDDHARKILDSLAKLIDYYPIKIDALGTQTKPESVSETDVLEKKTAETKKSVPKKRQTLRT